MLRVQRRLAVNRRCFDAATARHARARRRGWRWTCHAEVAEEPAIAPPASGMFLDVEVAFWKSLMPSCLTAATQNHGRAESLLLTLWMSASLSIWMLRSRRAESRVAETERTEMAADCGAGDLVLMMCARRCRAL